MIKPFLQLPLAGWFGIGVVFLLASMALFLAQTTLFQTVHLSPLTIAILLGVLVGNTVYHHIPSNWLVGIRLVQQKILRLGIILYGLQVTVQDIIAVGGAGLLIDIFIVGSVFLLGTWAGIRWLKLDRDTAMLTAAGSAICGAAAVLALEAVLQAKSYKTTAAVVTVVLFGTIAMFIYPFLFYVVDLDLHTFGIYIGATVHEVAQVVAASEAVSPETASTAVIVKLTRVMLLAPFLILLSCYLARSSKTDTKKSTILIPWFALGFILVSVINSFDIIPQAAIEPLIRFDIFLLAMAMAALGVETNIQKFKGMGWRPVLLAGGLFIYLIIVGYGLVKLI